MEKLHDISKMKHRLIDIANLELSKSTEQIDTKELVDVVDMIKDLAEAEEKCMKACYYEHIIESMESAENDGNMGYSNIRMGYDNWRYSSGRFAPKGHGHRTDNMGFNSSDYPPMMRDHHMTEDNYQRWKDARRHYTETHDKKDKDAMDSHAKAHMADVADTLKEIMSNSDPDLQRKMKNELTNLINDM